MLLDLAKELFKYLLQNFHLWSLNKEIQEQIKTKKRLEDVTKNDKNIDKNDDVNISSIYDDWLHKSKS